MKWLQNLCNFVFNLHHTALIAVWLVAKELQISDTLWTSVVQARIFSFTLLPEFFKEQLWSDVYCLLLIEDRFEESVIEERRRTAQDLLNFVGQRVYLTNSAAFKQFFQVCPLIY